MTKPPAIRIESVRKIYNDGNHNAFTDMCVFRGTMYLAFRSCPQGHMMFPTSRIVIMSSRDGKQWKKIHTFSVPLRDVRDPHFLVFKNTLFVYAGTWLCDPSEPEHFDVNDHLGFAAWTRDGRKWEGPKALEGTYGHYIWRAAASGKKAYLCGRRVHDFRTTRGEGGGDPTCVLESALLESDDGLVWKWAGFFTEEKGNETAFLFEKDGSILALARGQDSRICRSKPPFQAWKRKSLGCFVGGPMLVKWGKNYLVGGRKRIEGGQPKTALWWLVNDKLFDAAEFPSGGDTSYPGFVALSARKGLLSYYSSHEGSGTTKAPSAIYVAEISI